MRAPSLPKGIRPRWETPDPPGVAGSYGYLVIQWAAVNLGLIFGPWQRYVIIKILRHDKAGNLIHRTALWSTARQNGKSVIVRAFFGWLLDPDGGGAIPAFSEWRTILAAAHDAKQARLIYRAVNADLKGIPRLTYREPRKAHEISAPEPPVRLSQLVGIERDGLYFDTVTAEAGAARGQSVGAIAWDEMLTQRTFSMLEALAPTQYAQRNALMLLTSTAGYADSVVLRQMFDRLVRIDAGDEKPDATFWACWWASDDPAAGLDWRQVKKANPGLDDGRLSREALEAAYYQLPQESWQREVLNHFVDVRADLAFGPGVWSACRTPSPLQGLDGPYALAVDVQPGWERATISVGGIRQDGRIGVEVYRDLRHEPRNPVTAGRIISEIEAFSGYVAVIVFDSISGIGAELRRRGLETGRPYQELTRGQFVESCMDVTEMIHATRLAVDDPLLDAQMPFVARRPVGADGAFCFSRGNSLGPIDAFLSMTFAAHGIASMAGVPRIH